MSPVDHIIGIFVTFVNLGASVKPKAIVVICYVVLCTQVCLSVLFSEPP